VLPRSYQDLLEVAADAGRPLRAAEFAAAAGLATGKAKVEGLRSKLKPLAARGWLAGVPGGLFTLPDHAGKTGSPDGNGFFFLGAGSLEGSSDCPIMPNAPGRLPSPGLAGDGTPALSVAHVHAMPDRRRVIDGPQDRVGDVRASRLRADVTVQCRPVCP
jgi:hypothetical protein